MNRCKEFTNMIDLVEAHKKALEAKNKAIINAESLEKVHETIQALSEKVDKLLVEKEDLSKLNEEITSERDALKADLERIKTRYGYHLDTLNSEIVKLRHEAKKRIAAFVELMIELQDAPPKTSSEPLE